MQTRKLREEGASTCTKVAVAFLIAACAGPAWAEGLAGRVLQDHSGAPVPSADVRVRKAGERGLAAELETDSEGRFQAPGLAAGDYRVEVARPNYVNATMSVRIGSGAPLRLTIRLVRLGVITGRVMSAEGQPVTGAYVQVLTRAAAGALRPLPVRGQGGYAGVDDAGRYRLYNLAPGEYAVAVSYGASVTAVSGSGNVPPAAGRGSGLLLFPNNTKPEFFTISGGEELRNIDFGVAPAALFSLSGKVELPAPKTSFWATLTAVDQPSVGVAAAPADEDGAFRFEGIPLGSYHLFVVGPVRGRSGMGVVLGPDPLFSRSRVDVAGQDISGLSITPRKGRSAAVRLRADPGAESACPAAASVGFSSLEDWGAMFSATAQANREKDTVIENLAPGKYQLTASQLGENCYQAREVVLDLTGGEADAVAIPLAAAGSIRGRLTGGTPGEFSVILLASKTFGSPPEAQIALPDAEGRFTFAALPPGQYRIAAQRTSDSPKARWVAELGRMLEVEIVGGAPTDLQLPAPAAAVLEP